MTYQLHHGDCLNIMPMMDRDSIDAIVTDPPYGLDFMGKDWDHGVPGEHFWREAYRVAKPGAHLLAFGGTRTFHRLACAIEDAGWEIRDCVMWVYGQGFPKSHDVSKAIDREAGAEREVIGRKMFADGTTQRATARAGIYSEEKGQAFETAPATPAAAAWDGWGTALKPAWEPIIVARKPLCGTVAENVQRYGTGAINVDACRVPSGYVHKGDYSSADNDRVHTADQRNRIQNTLHQEGDSLQREQSNDRSSNGPEYEAMRQQLLGSQGDCQTCHRCGGVLVHPSPMGDQASSLQQVDVPVPQCRCASEQDSRESLSTYPDYTARHIESQGHSQGRWPSNLIHDGSAEVLAGFPMTTSQGHIPKSAHKDDFWSLHKNKTLATESNNAFNDTGSAARFFYCAPHDKLDLLFCRAKAIIGAWTKYDVPTAESDSPLPSQRAGIVLSDVVTLVSRGEILLNDLKGLSTSVTQIELRRISEALTTAILSLENAPLPDLLQGAVIPNGCLVKFAEIQKQTGITTITISQWKSDGSADVATFSTMQALKDHGAADSANRFVYCAKARKQDRDEGLEGLDEVLSMRYGEKEQGPLPQQTPSRPTPQKNNHPTVKPTALMRYLCRLVTPPGGVILDPFAGSGSTGKAAILEGFNFIGIDTELEYVEISARRIEHACGKVGIVIDQPLLIETRREMAEKPKQMILL